MFYVVSRLKCSAWDIQSGTNSSQTQDSKPVVPRGTIFFRRNHVPRRTMHHFAALRFFSQSSKFIQTSIRPKSWEL
jgi:hypothetical protein